MTKTLAHLEKDPTAQIQFFTGPLGEKVPDVNSRIRLVIRNSDGVHQIVPNIHTLSHSKESNQCLFPIHAVIR